jgi:hypothetical protein
VTTYGQLVRTAHKRMFKLRDQLAGRYEALSTPDLLTKILKEPFQMPLQAQPREGEQVPPAANEPPIPSTTV